LFLLSIPGIDGGGFCQNSTVYCSFGCCGTIENQLCCFPIGVLIGCGFGTLGTICLLITIFRCQFGKRSAPVRRGAATESLEQDTVHVIGKESLEQETVTVIGKESVSVSLYDIKQLIK